jgi:hypothetical protein
MKSFPDFASFTRAPAAGGGDCGTFRRAASCLGSPYRPEEDVMGRGLLLWLIGIPLPIILIVWLLGGLHG